MSRTKPVYAVDTLKESGGWKPASLTDMTKIKAEKQAEELYKRPNILGIRIMSWTQKDGYKLVYSMTKSAL